MNLTILVEIRSGPEDEEPLKLIVLIISTLEIGSKAIDLRQGGPR